MQRWFTYEWTYGKAHIATIEPLVELSVGYDPDLGEHTIYVDAMTVDGINILEAADPVLKALAEKIKQAVLEDEDLVSECQMEAA